MERKRRTYIHRSKVRYKQRLPRKLKKARKKGLEERVSRYMNCLIKLHGDNWMEYWIIGG